MYYRIRITGQQLQQLHKRREDRKGQEGEKIYLVFQASSGREMNQNQNYLITLLVTYLLLNIHLHAEILG